MEQRPSEQHQAGTFCVDTVGSYSNLHRVVHYILQVPARSTPPLSCCVVTTVYKAV